MSVILHRRAIEEVIVDHLRHTQVVRVTGPRAAGKTTTCVRVIDRLGGSVVRLDDPATLAAVRTDPAGALQGLPTPILVDEFQRAPDVVGVVKGDVAATRATGRWILCGSAALTTSAVAVDSLGGRLHDIAMGTLTLDERQDRPEPTFVADLLGHGVQHLRGWRASVPMDRPTLLAEARRGGFPLITDRATPEARRSGIEDWVRASVIADAAAVGGIRDAESLRRMLELYAATTGQIVPKDSPLADRLGIDRRTVASYRDLLIGLHAVWTLPSLVPGNAVGQVTRSPKLHLIDTAVAAHLTGRDSDEALGRDPQFTGQLAETMVANDLRVQCTVHPSSPRLRHFREDRHEVDLVIEDHAGAVWGVEVKLSAQPGNRDLNGLRRLARSAGDRFAGGVVLCRTPIGHQTEDGLMVAPIEAIWG